MNYCSDCKSYDKRANYCRRLKIKVSLFSYCMMFFRQRAKLPMGGRKMKERVNKTCEYMEGPHECGNRADYKVYQGDKFIGVACAECQIALQMTKEYYFKPIMHRQVTAGLITK